MDESARSIRELWREHVVSSVAWGGLLADGCGDEHSRLGVCLDLYLGGGIVHEFSGAAVICRGCRVLGVGSGSDLCEIHMGIIEGFLAGITGGRLRCLGRETDGQTCMVKILR